MTPLLNLLFTSNISYFSHFTVVTVIVVLLNELSNKLGTYMVNAVEPTKITLSHQSNEKRNIKKM